MRGKEGGLRKLVSSLLRGGEPHLSPERKKTEREKKERIAKSGKRKPSAVRGNLGVERREHEAFGQRRSRVGNRLALPERREEAPSVWGKSIEQEKRSFSGEGTVPCLGVRGAIGGPYREKERGKGGGKGDISETVP